MNRRNGVMEMTKTHAELLGCPHCGAKPIYNVHCTPGSVHCPPEYDEEIYCSNGSCTPNQSLESWNNRINKEAEFLEELKNRCRRLSELKNPCYFCSGEIRTYEEIADEIEQFQAEQERTTK
jgi:hypothetical protein